jgi:hypothetical protein
MTARIHRPLRVIAFNANGIWRQRYELSKQLQDLHIDVAVLLETHLKPHESFFITNYHFNRIGRFPGRKDIPHNYVNLCYICDAYTWQRRSLLIKDKPISSSERMLQKGYFCRGSVGRKKNLVVILKELGAKMKRLAVSRQS